MSIFEPSQPHPRDIYPAGMELPTLRTAESLLIVALRLWTARRLDPDGRHVDWRDGFLAAGVCTVGTACFNSFLNIVAASARVPISLGCPRCPELSDDEARLLCVVAGLQSERAHDAALLLAEWLPPAAIRIAVDYAFGFATALAEARLTLPRRADHAASPQTRDVHAPRFVHRAASGVLH